MKITQTEIIRHNISRALLLGAMFATPLAAMAQTTYDTSSSGQQTNTLSDLVSLAVGYFNQAIYLIIALAVVTFVWNVYRYFIISDAENRGEASKYVMYSVIGLFVILSFWGLVNIVSNTLNLNTSASSINIGALTGQSSSNNTFGTTGSQSTTQGSGGSSLIFQANF